MPPSHKNLHNADGFSVNETLSGKSVLIIGGTGFLGQVMLFMLLRFVIKIKKVYVFIRPTHSRTAKERFEKEVLSSPVFTTNENDIAFFTKLCPEKVEILQGDVTQKMLGLSDEELKMLREEVNVVLNTAGNVEFNPPIDKSIQANALATWNVLDFVSTTRTKKYVHVSTCFVTDRNIHKEHSPEEHIASTIKTSNGDTIEIDPKEHIINGLKEIQTIKDSYDENESWKNFVENAKKNFERLNQKEPSERLVKRAAKNLQSVELREKLIQLGQRKAKEIQRPNVYTYTKTLAELLVQSYNKQLDATIVRPSIVESSIQHPFQGWNEGVQGTAPLLYLAVKGHRMFPSVLLEKGSENANALLDCIPVDSVASGTILAMCALLRNEHEPIYQLSIGSQNHSATIFTFMQIAQNFRNEKSHAKTGLISWSQRNLQPYGVTKNRFNRFSSPRTFKILSAVRQRMDKLKIEKLSPKNAELTQKARVHLEKSYQKSLVINKIFQEFFPFTYEEYPLFLNDNTKALYKKLPKSEKDIFYFAPYSIDYLNYLSNIHIEALDKWIFPILEKRFHSLEKITAGSETLLKGENIPQKLNSFIRGTFSIASELSFIRSKKTFQRLISSRSLKRNWESRKDKSLGAAENIVPKNKEHKLKQSIKLPSQLEQLCKKKISEDLSKEPSECLQMVSDHLEFLYGARISPERIKEVKKIRLLEKEVEKWMLADKNHQLVNSIYLADHKNKGKNKLLPQEGIRIPESLRDPSSDFLYEMQMWFYRRLLQVKVQGRDNIPLNNNHVIIAANHSSHLDYGAVWHSLGKYGRDLGILAAKDYFFNQFWKSTFFGNFLNLIPIERTNNAGYSEIFRPALDFLSKEGAPLLIFPEGSRSIDGTIKPFRIGLGYLIYHSGADILPIRLHNTHAILPKGKTITRLNRDIKIKIDIGTVIPYDEIVSGAKDFTSLKRYNYLAKSIYKIVCDM